MVCVYGGIYSGFASLQYPTPSVKVGSEIVHNIIRMLFCFRNIDIACLKQLMLKSRDTSYTVAISKYGTY